MQVYELKQAHYDTQFNRTLSNPVLYDGQFSRTLSSPILSGTKEQCWQEAFNRGWVPQDMDVFWWGVNFDNGYCTIQRVTP